MESWSQPLRAYVEVRGGVNTTHAVPRSPRLIATRGQPIVNIDELRVLAPGGAGFIGWHMFEDLVHRGSSVWVRDDASWGQEADRDPVGHDVEIVSGETPDPRERCHARVSGRTWTLRITPAQRENGSS